MKVGIVGSGFVGATAGYALVMRGVGRELILVDKNHARAEAEADDIRHAVPFAHALQVRAGGYEDLRGCRAILICAGVGQKPGETRLQLLQRNAGVFAQVMPQVLSNAPEAVLVVSSNPVDVMTHIAAGYAASYGVPAGRVLGSGTTLDTARFRSLLGLHCGVDPQHIHAYVVGEHGDSEVLTWSLATVGGMPLKSFARLRGIDSSEAIRQEIDAKVRRAAYSIIAGKGATYYGIGSALARILEVILHDQRAILTVCTPTAEVAGERDVTVALPRLLGGKGVLETLSLDLNEEETKQLRDSARVIRQALVELKGEIVTEVRDVGESSPLGATIVGGGVNFSVFSRSAAGMELLLFDHADDVTPARVIRLDPSTNRTYHYWHHFVSGVGPGQIYAYRAHGAFDPARGLRFDPAKVLLDPYGRGVVVPKKYDRRAAAREGDNTAMAMKSVIIDPSTYDWEGDVPLRRPSSRTIIYEMHVRGFTRHPSSGVPERTRGTYAGLIEKIPYLQELGITAVELLPVFQFDAQDCPRGLVNYWGYQPVSFFSPHQAYSSRQDPLGPVEEFRDMVKALHRAGIEIILDVVFNHTSEGDHGGPTFCFRGLDNAIYYTLESDRARYANYSGCGNTLNANNPIVRRMIVDSIRYWVEQMHVDGFRFDLASILSRDSRGHVLPNPPVLWDLESDPALAGTKLIAEAWDAAGLYQVGGFIGDSWKEWNGRFRDDARSFFRGEPGSVKRFADRMVGSPEIYGHKQREPEQSVNFITCHDGFTLNDLVSYDHKHNESNGENGRDGGNDNLSWNCGVEGPTDDPAVERLRNRQVKNLLAVTLLSIGMPMILMGDEVRRTQGGNNNFYCHDNESNWFDWTLLKRHEDVHRFVSLLNARRVQRALQHERLSLNQIIQRAKKSWHGVKLDQPDWGESSRSIALTAELRGEGMLFHLVLNAYWEALEFELPETFHRRPVRWRRWIDTSLNSPEDIVGWQTAPPISGYRYHTESRTVVMLIAEVGGKSGSS